MKKIFTLITAFMAFATIQAQNLTEQICDSYNGYVQIVITTDEGTGASDPIPAKVEIVKKSDNTIDFQLKNFVLSNEGEMMPVGNILLSDILLTAAAQAGEVDFEISQDINITEGDADALEAVSGVMWMGPFLGPIPVDLKGTAGQTFADIDIDINLEALGQVVHVDFIAGERDAAVKGITAGQTNTATYNILGQHATKGLIIQNGRKYIRT